MKRAVVSLMLISTLAAAGCADLSPTTQRTLTGGVGGAAAGAAIGAIAGNAGMGALIGAAAGTAGGYLYGKHKEAEANAYQQGVQAGRAQSQGGQ